jgi:hypothetical protein
VLLELPLAGPLIAAAGVDVYVSAVGQEDEPRGVLICGAAVSRTPVQQRAVGDVLGYVYARVQAHQPPRGHTSSFIRGSAGRTDFVEVLHAYLLLYHNCVIKSVQLL